MVTLGILKRNISVLDVHGFYFLKYVLMIFGFGFFPVTQKGCVVNTKQQQHVKINTVILF